MRRATILFMAAGLFAFGGIGYFAGSNQLLAPAHAVAADDCQTFPQTGKMACGDFLKYWQEHGALAQQGYPISDVFEEKSETDGITHKIQYFERAVFEAHPENPPPNNVLLSLLGSQKYKAKYGTGAVAAPVSPPKTSSATAATEDIHLPAVAGSTGTIVDTAGGTGTITFVRILDPAPSNNQFEQPKPGNKYIGFEIVVQNIGAKDVYLSTSPYLLRATDGFEYPGETESGVGQSISAEKLSPGGKRQGFVVFEVPTTAKTKFIRYKPSSVSFGVYFDL